MNILSLEITDLKKIRAIEIHPETGKPVILTGDNGNGKSSVLDGIVLALSNTGLDDPIRHGRPSASVKLTLGADKAKYTLERRVTKKGAYLTLTDANGAPVQKAQTFLNGLLGNYAFDPLEFTRLRPPQQVEALKTAAGLDFSQLDAERAQVFAERTEVNREGKEIAARFAAMPEPEEGLPEEEQNASSLVARLSDLEEKVRNVATLEKEVKEGEEFLSRTKETIRKLEDELAQAKADLETCEEDHKETVDQLVQAKSSAPTPEQIGEAREAIDKLDSTNASIRAGKLRKETEAKLNDLRNRSAKLSRRIEEIDETKADNIKNSNLPLDGLELTDEGVMFNGTFFSQLSTAEQIRVSALVAMSQNPDLRIILIREGALMNSANLAMLSELAASNGYQLWIEKFQENASDTGIHIVDGSIAAVDGKEPETEA